MLATLYFGALTAQELALLDLNDVDLNTRLLTISGLRPRVQPIGQRLADTLEGYMTFSRPFLGSERNDPAVFLTRDGKRLAKANIYQTVRLTAASVGLKHVSPRVLRDSCAEHVLSTRHDAAALKELLGFRSIAAARQYMRQFPYHLLRAHRRSHPRNQPPPSEAPT